MPTLVFRRVANCVVLIHPEQAPSDGDWDEYLRFLLGYYREVFPPRFLIVTKGAGPNSKQRARLDRISRAQYASVKVAVVTGSTFARGLVRAFSLLHPFYRAFEPKALDEALVYLDVAPRDMASIKDALARSYAELGTPPLT